MCLAVECGINPKAQRKYMSLNCDFRLIQSLEGIQKTKRAQKLNTLHNLIQLRLNTCTSTTSYILILYLPLQAQLQCRLVLEVQPNTINTSLRFYYSHYTLIQKSFFKLRKVTVKIRSTTICWERQSPRFENQTSTFCKTSEIITSKVSY